MEDPPIQWNARIAHQSASLIAVVERALLLTDLRQLASWYLSARVPVHHPFKHSKRKYAGEYTLEIMDGFLTKFALLTTMSFVRFVSGPAEVENLRWCNTGDPTFSQGGKCVETQLPYFAFDVAALPHRLLGFPTSGVTSEGHVWAHIAI
ncbi:MAG: hypothetical protein WBG86_13930 [Polyangiales bacterium]